MNYKELIEKLERAQYNCTSSNDKESIQEAIDIINSIEDNKEKSLRQLINSIYNFFCTPKHWYEFKEQWLCGGQCPWLIDNLNNILESV